MWKKTAKREVILLAVIFAAIMFFFIAVRFSSRDDGAVVRVSVDGEIFGEYKLETSDGQSQVIEIDAAGYVTNTLVIEDGYAYMSEADCPDKLCIHQGKISSSGGVIVCLPNRVVVEIENADAEDEFDAVAQ